MNLRHLIRCSLVLGVVLVGLQPINAATVQLNNNPERLFGNGSANGGGLLDGHAGFTTTVTSSNANVADSAYFQEVQDFKLRTWIDDQSSGQSNWSSSMTIDFSLPITGLKIVPDSPANTSDTVLWSVSWVGSSAQGNFVNSPNVVNGHSLYNNAGRLPNGTYVSGTTFRLDDDGTAGADTNNTNPNDLNVGIPSTPWTINLPADVTSVTVSALIVDGGNIHRAREGFGFDFSEVVIPPVPEPANLGIAALIGLLVFARRRR